MLRYLICHPRPLFLFVFSTVECKEMFMIDGWIRTWVIWCGEAIALPSDCATTTAQSGSKFGSISLGNIVFFKKNWQTQPLFSLFSVFSNKQYKKLPNLVNPPPPGPILPSSREFPVLVSHLIPGNGGEGRESSKCWMFSNENKHVPRQTCLFHWQSSKMITSVEFFIRRDEE